MDNLPLSTQSQPTPNAPMQIGDPYAALLTQGLPQPLMDLLTRANQSTQPTDPTTALPSGSMADIHAPGTMLWENDLGPAALPPTLSLNEAHQLTQQLGGHDSTFDMNADSFTPEQAVYFLNNAKLGHAPTNALQYGSGGSPQYISPNANRADVVNAVHSAAEKVFGKDQLPALDTIIMKESGFNPTAQNPHSTAYGLFQFLDSTRKNYGISRDASLQDQISAGLKYIADRYGSPEQALAFHNENGWY